MFDMPNIDFEKITRQLAETGGRTHTLWQQDGTLAFAPVTLGVQGLDGTVQLLDSKEGGLAEGDTVVLYSQSALKPGARIAVVDQLVPPGAKK